MRRLALMLLFSLGSCAVPEPAGPMGPPAELIGRTAGGAQRCVMIEPSSSLRVSNGDRHTLVYGSGRTIWANHLGPGCGFGSDDLLITEPTGSYHCRGDLVRSIDRLSHIPGPACVLGDFVSYTRG